MRKEKKVVSKLKGHSAEEIEKLFLMCHDFVVDNIRQLPK